MGAVARSDSPAEDRAEHSCRAGRRIFPIPENFLGVLLSRAQWGSNNDSFYSNPEVEQLLD